MGPPISPGWPPMGFGSALGLGVWLDRQIRTSTPQRPIVRCSSFGKRGLRAKETQNDWFPRRLRAYCCWFFFFVLLISPIALGGRAPLLPCIQAARAPGRRTPWGLFAVLLHHTPSPVRKPHTAHLSTVPSPFLGYLPLFPPPPPPPPPRSYAPSPSAIRPAFSLLTRWTCPRPPTPPPWPRARARCPPAPPRPGTSAAPPLL